MLRLTMLTASCNTNSSLSVTAFYELEMTLQPPEMIPSPKMISKSTPANKSRSRNASHFFSCRPRNHPRLILGVEWYPRTMDQEECATLINKRFH